MRRRKWMIMMPGMELGGAFQNRVGAVFAAHSAAERRDRFLQDIRFRLHVRVVEMFSLLVVLSSLFVSSSHAGADRETQARMTASHVVTRAALHQIAGVGVDLPYRLARCRSQIEKDRMFQFIKLVSATGGTVGSGGSSLCYPVSHTVRRVGRNFEFTFLLPAASCPAIQSEVRKALNDSSGISFENLLDRPTQEALSKIDEFKGFGFSNTSGQSIFRRFNLLVGACTEISGGAGLLISATGR